MLKQILSWYDYDYFIDKYAEYKNSISLLSFRIAQ